MLSILIPTYNYNVSALVEHLLDQGKCLDIPFEIRILDDASDKLTFDKDTFGHEDIVHFSRNESNLGRTASRNYLAQSATYENLLFLDADVWPVTSDFIKDYSVQIDKVQVVFGGINYSDKKPGNDEILRWKYGRAREAKDVKKRSEMPYLSIISQSVLIKKSVFLKANTYTENAYGLDVLFSTNLENLGVSVLHIDNPVFHLGLETSEAFIKKSISGIKTLYTLEQQGHISKNYRPIQKAFLKLKKYNLVNSFIILIRASEKTILRNLRSNKPSLFLFDVYRLYHFAHLQYSYA